MSATSAVYREQEGDVLVVGSGGELKIDGGTITNAGTQASVIADIAITYSANDPSITPNGAVTVADGSTPTVAELLELCEEIIAKQNAIIDALQGAGIVATS